MNTQETELHEAMNAPTPEYQAWSDYYFYRDTLYFYLRNGGITKKHYIELQKKYTAALNKAEQLSKKETLPCQRN